MSREGLERGDSGVRVKELQHDLAKKADYNCANNTCAAGRVCGHYTQIVWRTAIGVGCASKVCATGSPFGSGTWLFWVCDYRPPGNYLGMKPY